ncbi:hypothetical protein GCM10022223_45620 [Kineosporia mesophila]|uniref:Uncharacterized protein n=1 Tax=Kineosporia mesophila TaxID=566012 RepID=A0ABP7A298_9ACTN
MFPDAYDDPTGRGEEVVRLLIASDVLSQLRCPVPLVAGGFTPMDRTDMPEAAVNEDGDLGPGEDDVGTSPTARKIKTKIFAETVASSMQR